MSRNSWGKHKSFMEQGTNTSSTSSRSLCPDKAYAFDGIKIHMWKLCATLTSKPLNIIFNNSIINECFPNEWKKINIIPVHEKVTNK